MASAEPTLEGRLTTALKEWAVTVRALERGDQSLLLRKGGIAERGQAFEPRHGAFLLFPTFEHQDEGSLQPRYHPLLEETLQYPHQDSRIPVGSWARVVRAYRVTALEPILGLEEEYVWSPQEVRGRFAWKPERPLHLLALRVYRLPEVRELALKRQYSGCRSWVDLHEVVDTAGSEPVLDDGALADRLGRIEAEMGG